MKLENLMKDPKFYAILALGRILPDHLDFDRLFLKLLYRNRLKKKLPLDNPTTYNEKLQWLKLYNRNPRYTKWVNKIMARLHAGEIIGYDHMVTLLGVWDDFDSITFEDLPDRFVLKCNHDSGGIVRVEDKSTFDRLEAKRILDHSLRRHYYKNTREWPYKNVEPRVFAEIYLPLNDCESAEVKMFCFDGRVEYIMICLGDKYDQTQRTNDIYDRDFNHLPVIWDTPNAKKEIKKPEKWQELLDIGEKLSNGFPHVRVDTYLIKDKIYFGELTFFNYSGLTPFIPEEWDRIFGDQITLPPKYIEEDAYD